MGAIPRSSCQGTQTVASLTVTLPDGVPLGSYAAYLMWDPAVLSLTGLALAGAVVAAAYLPARRAAALDPAQVLRNE